MRAQPRWTAMNSTVDNTDLVCHHTLDPVFTTVGLVFMCCIIFSSLLGNVLVCTAVTRFHYLQTNSNYLVFSLAISDMLVASIVIPFDIVYWVNFPYWPLGGYICNLWNALFFLCLTASVLNLLAISVDRFIAVMFPLRYQCLIGVTCIKSTITSVWLYAITVGLVVFFRLVPSQSPVYTFDLDPSLHAFLLVGNVLVPFIIMIVLYFKIYLIASEHARRVGNSSSTMRNVIGRELRVAKALGIVLVTFVICWLPFEVINVVILIEGYQTCAIEVLDTVTCWLAYMQCAMNPIIFAFANADFRRAFRKILRLQTNESRLHPQTTNNRSAEVKEENNEPQTKDHRSAEVKEENNEPQTTDNRSAEVKEENNEPQTTDNRSAGVKEDNDEPQGERGAQDVLPPTDL